MRLNHHKTVTVPLDMTTSADDDPITRTTRYFESLATSWNTARVRQDTVYLGIRIGPTAATNMWIAPVDRWKRRARQLAASGVAQDSTLREHTGRALPCLSYLAHGRTAA